MSEFSANTLRNEVVLSGKKVRLIALDNFTVDVPVEYCAPCKHIVNTLEMSEEEELPTMDLPTVNERTLRALLAFMEEYVKEPYPKLPKTIPKEGLYSLLRPFYKDFLAMKVIEDGTPDPAVDTGVIPEDKSTVVELLQVADLMDIPSLKQLLVSKLFDTVRGKNIKDMFKIFNIPDHVPEWKDFEEIRQRHAYAFEQTTEEDGSSSSAAGAVAGNA